MSPSSDAGSRVAAFGDDVLGDLDAVALSQMVADGEASAHELAEAAISRAELIQPLLNPVAFADYERALTTASPTVQQFQSTGVVTLGLSTTSEFALMGTVERP